MQMEFGGMVLDVEQHNPGGTCREAGCHCHTIIFLEKAGPSLPQLSTAEVRVHREEGFDFIFWMTCLR